MDGKSIDALSDHYFNFKLPYCTYECVGLLSVVCAYNSHYWLLKEIWKDSDYLMRFARNGDK